MFSHADGEWKDAFEDWNTLNCEHDSQCISSGGNFYMLYHRIGKSTLNKITLRMLHLQ